MKRTRSAQRPNRKKRTPLYLLTIAFLLLGSALVLLRLSGVGSPKGSEPINEMVDSTELMQYAKSVKQDLKDVFSHLRDEDVSELEKSVDQLDSDVGALKSFLSAPVWSMSEKLPVIGREVTTAKELIDVAQSLSADLLRPWISLNRDYELPEGAEPEPGSRAATLQAKICFFAEKLPLIKSLVERVESRDLSLIDSDGKLSRSLSAASSLLRVADKYSGDLFDPLVALMAEYPLAELQTESGYDYEALSQYSTLLADKFSTVKSLLGEVGALDLSAVDESGKVKAFVAYADELLPLLETANSGLLQPGLRLLAEYPSDSIKADGGFNAVVLSAYLNFLDEKMPQIEAMLDYLDTLDLSQIDPKGETTAELRAKLVTARELYRTYGSYFSAAKVVLADGNDRTYLLVAQNGAEIRASGGFPGVVAIVEIRDGVLKIKSFDSVYSAFSERTSSRIGITAQERTLFTDRMFTSWDTDFCPNFERVGEIWASAYEQRKGVAPDGVISATPIIVQKLLKVSGTTVPLSNGMVLDSESAIRVLQRDIYFEYKRAGMVVYTEDDMTDILFAEAVEQTIKILSSELSLSSVTDFIEVVRESIEERVLMFWMADPDEENVIIRAGWSGGMSRDPNDPKLGIFFSSEQSSKMGYFLDMIPEIGEPVVNEDGSRTYPVTLTLSNVITKEEQRIGGTWILGRDYPGTILGDLTLTAPAGGKITDTYTGLPRGMRQDTYEGLDTHFIQWLFVERGNPLVIRFKVTTAPGVEAPLGILATPTLTEYRGQSDEPLD